MIKRNHASEGTNDTYDNTGGVANLALTLFVSTVKSGGHKYPSPAEAGEGELSVGKLLKCVFLIILPGRRSYPGYLRKSELQHLNPDSIFGWRV